MMKWFKSLRWGLRHFYLCNSLSSMSDSGKDSNGKFPTWVNISASPCLSLLMHIYIPLASRWAITRRNKKVTIRESDLQTAFNAWSCILPQTAEGKDSKSLWVICSLGSPLRYHSSGISWAASWDYWLHHLFSMDISSISEGSNSTVVKTWCILGLCCYLWSCDVCHRYLVLTGEIHLSLNI